jgi:hypothetical protein
MNSNYINAVMVVLLGIVITTLGTGQVVRAQLANETSAAGSPIQNGQTVNTPTEDNTVWHDIGHTPLGGIDTGVLRNGSGVFIPWKVICAQGQSQGFLLQSCSELIDSNGVLTAAGNRAIGCINNGLDYAVKAAQSGISLDLTKTLLSAGASITGCNGIVDLDKMQNSPMIQFALHSMGH